jgi:dienelactone hydrolase
MKTVLATILLFWLAHTTLPGQTTFLEPKLDYGPHAIGFKAFHEYDYSRTVQDTISPFLKTPVKNRARPVQICVWYPAAAKKGLRDMPYADYLKLMATEFDFNYSGNPLEHPFVKERLFEDPFFKKEQVDAALKAYSIVYKNAPSAPGSFPVIVYGPGGFGSCFENAALFEYLASHGFIVASFPSTPIDHAPVGAKEPFGPWTFEPRARDMEFVIAFMHRFPNADSDQLGLMGFSLGGASAVTVASRNIGVKAVASLDGWHEPFNLPWLTLTDIKKIKAPFLNMRRKIPGGDPNRMVYDSLKQQDAYRVVFNVFGHTFFGSSWILLTDHAAADENAVKGTQEEINLGYNLLSTYVLHFFNAYLRRNEKSLAALKVLHKRTDLPAGFLDFESK